MGSFGSSWAVVAAALEYFAAILKFSESFGSLLGVVAAALGLLGVLCGAVAAALTPFGSLLAPLWEAFGAPLDAK